MIPGIDAQFADLIEDRRTWQRDIPAIRKGLADSDARSFEGVCMCFIQEWANRRGTANELTIDEMLAGLLAMRAERAAALAEAEDAPVAPVLSLVRAGAG